MTHLWPPRALGLQTPAQEGLERETGRVKGVGAGSQTEAGSGRRQAARPSFPSAAPCGFWALRVRRSGPYTHSAGRLPCLSPQKIPVFTEDFSTPCAGYCQLRIGCCQLRVGCRALRAGCWRSPVTNTAATHLNRGPRGPAQVSTLAPPRAKSGAGPLGNPGPTSANTQLRRQAPADTGAKR